MEPESLNNSWADDRTSMFSYTTEQLSPQDALIIIDILKNQRISDIDATFTFKRQSHLKKFLESVQKEEQNQRIEQRGRNDQKKKKKYTYTSPNDLGKQFKYQLLTNSPIVTQIFLKAYEQRIKKLEIQHNVSIYKGGQNIIVASQRNNKNNILSSQMMAMLKKLKVYTIYKSPQIWKIVESSHILQKQFQNQGICCHFHLPRSRTLAFYSSEHSEQEIKTIVQKKLGYTLKIFDFYDKDLKKEKNLAIFELLVKAVNKKINQIREKYETILEINQQACCFVLHIKHDAFAKQPISQLEDIISGLTFVSFRLRNSRNYLNQIKRIAKSHPYLEVTQGNHHIYCCINNKKIKKKDEIMFIFKRFLENIGADSRLTVHLKANNLFFKDSMLPSKILQLIQQNKLTCDFYQQIFNKQKHNIHVAVKNPESINKNNKAQKQVQFANFIIKLLDFNSSIQDFTEEEIKQTFLQDEKRQIEQDEPKIQSKSAKSPKKESHKSNENIPLEQDKYIGATIQFKDLEVILGEQQSIMKADKLKKLQEAIYQQQTLKYRCWAISVPKTKFELPGQLIDGTLFLIKQVMNKENEKKLPQPISFTMVQSGQEVYLVKMNKLMQDYIPVAIIKRL